MESGKNIQIILAREKKEKGKDNAKKQRSIKVILKPC